MTIATALGAGTCFARPHPGGHRPPPPRHHHGGHHHHGGSYWGRGGRNFLPGFVGGLVGGALIGSTTRYVSTAPVVVTTTPVYTTQSVWVEGRYIDQVQPNGTVLRVWQPGHYEQRQVIVQ